MKFYRKTLSIFVGLALVLLTANQAMAEHQDCVELNPQLATAPSQTGDVPLANEQLIALHLNTDAAALALDEDSSPTNTTAKKSLQRPGFSKHPPSPKGDLYCILVDCPTPSNNALNHDTGEQAAIQPDTTQPHAQRASLSRLLSPLPQDQRFLRSTQQQDQALVQAKKNTPAGPHLLARASTQRPGFPSLTPVASNDAPCNTTNCYQTKLLTVSNNATAAPSTIIIQLNHSH